MESSSFGSSNRTLTFQSHWYATNIGTLSVDDFHNGAWIANVWSFARQQQSNQSSNWLEESVDLIAYMSLIKIRFTATAFGGWKDDIAVDPVQIIGKP